MNGIRKIVVLVPNHNDIGGISSFYGAIYPHLESKYIYVEKFSKKKLLFIRIINRFKWYGKIFKAIHIHKPSHIILNMGYGLNALIRDSLPFVYAKYKGITCICYVHTIPLPINVHFFTLTYYFFKVCYKNVDTIIVSTRTGYNYFKTMNPSFQVCILTTTYNEKTLIYVPTDKDSTKEFCMLFLGRIIQKKGIYLFLGIHHLLQKKYAHVKSFIVGSGKELKHVQQYVKHHNIQQVVFTGSKIGNEKYAILKRADILLFTSQYIEAYPISILEAMYMGLPIVANVPKGSISFLKNGKMGYIMHDVTLYQCASMIEKLMIDKIQYKTISKYNHEYVKHYFSSMVIAQKFHKIVMEA